MQKNSITNKITRCCNLPFSIMYWWVSNLNLNTESDRQFIISKMSQSGTISVDAWIVLINSGELELDSPMTKGEFLKWFDCGVQPNCNQLKLLIEAFKIGNYNPLNDYKNVWTIVDAYEDYNGKLIKKIVDIVGGVEPPDVLKDLIGMYYSVNGGFTINKDLALDFNDNSDYYNDGFII